MRTAEIVSVGTELLLGQIVDTHAPFMARILAECGVSCLRRHTVGDNLDRLTDTLRGMLERADVVVAIGGLGPTMDDLTRDAIAAALGDELVRDAEYEQELRAWFARRDYPFAESNARQADVPASGRMIPNPNGTAPGLLCEKGGKTVIAMPGPKGEFNPMAEGPVRQYLEGLGEGVIHSRTLRVVGVGESMVEERIRDLMQGGNPTVAPYAHTGEVHLRLTARALTREAAEALIAPVQKEIERALGNAVYGSDEETLEAAVVRLLTAREEKVAVAESITGGQMAARLTNVPGSSLVFEGGAVTYTVDAKNALLAVPQRLLDEFGPVSSEVAHYMAEGIRARLNTDYGVSLTGNAGPTSDVDGKPVGLVYVGLAGPRGTETQEHRFRGTREDVQRRSTQVALQMLRETLKGGAPG